MVKICEKGQIKIQQMAFMLLAIFILFVMIGIVIVSSKISKLEETAVEYQEQNALTLASKIANSPEFSCGNSFGNQKSDCVDLEKVLGLKKIAEDYEDFWEVSNIEIRIIYPQDEEEIECSQENYPNCNYIDLLEKGISGFSVSNYVSVCHKEKNINKIVNICELGQIIVSYEVEND